MLLPDHSASSRGHVLRAAVAVAGNTATQHQLSSLGRATKPTWFTLALEKLEDGCRNQRTACGQRWARSGAGLSTLFYDGLCVMGFARQCNFTVATQDEILEALVGYGDCHNGSQRKPQTSGFMCHNTVHSGLRVLGTGRSAASTGSDVSNAPKIASCSLEDALDHP